MIRVSMNIISSGSAMNYVPMSWEFDSSRDFTYFIRQNAVDILSWSHENSVSKSKTKLGVLIIEDDEADSSYYEWSFVIDCNNIREFRPYIKMSRQDFDATWESRKRDKKLKELLDE